MKNKIVIIAGDPNSINSEIIYKSWKKLNNKVKDRIYLIANYKLIFKQLKKLKYKIKVLKVENINQKSLTNSLKIIDVPLAFKDPFNVSLKSSSKYIINSLNFAHKIVSSNKIKGLINCPINKRNIQSSKKIGVTEYLASKCKITDNSEVMMIYNNRLSVVPLTTHIKVRDVSKAITTNLIIKKVNTLEKQFKKLFKKKPKIGILGLNPHNAELIKDSEEVKKILPAILKLKKIGINIKGPLVADTTFVNNYKRFNIIVGMYHDQVLSPFKSLFHFDAINITLGLKYIRVSPDHGPALDLIKKNKSNYLSLLQCINFINNLK
ncbi:MAG: hypothetical protein CBC88_00615 [Candidatus Pelagibacter sp. TMED128]|nr:MAG: hypothetical protein CBC88_00615 [Candidatus Pelagibacter sp. TMED128]|tara:strand:- start:747 stop:1712 length:966 start_codon:yes stop_codon:yes gene_type:complete